MYYTIDITEILSEGHENILVNEILSESNKIFIGCFAWKKSPDFWDTKWEFYTFLMILL